MNELDKLRQMLTDAGIPFESTKEEWPQEAPDIYFVRSECEADKYRINQVIYGRYKDERRKYSWKFDAILQWGSFDRHLGLLETFGDLGTTKGGDPLTMTAENAFEIIKTDYEKTKEENPNARKN